MVTAVVCAAFDPAGDTAVAAVRAELRDLGARVPRDPAHRPHLTLSAAQAEDPGPVAAAVERIAQRHQPIRVTLGEVGCFARGGIVWLGPAAPAALRDLQRDVHESLIEAGWPAVFGPQSDPDRWIAHCTLARRVAPAAVAELRIRYRPIEATIDALVTLVVGGRGDVARAPL